MQTAVFLLTSSIAIAMLAEGFMILVLKKTITPLPSRILYGLGIPVVGRERSAQLFLGRTSLTQLRAYAVNVLISGSLLVISSIVYLISA